MQLFTYLVGIPTLLWAMIFPEKPTPKILTSEFIYETAPFPSCHASTLIETEDGILASWFGGTYERHPDVNIYTALKKGGSWSTPAEVADGIENEDFRNPTWNPVLYQLEDGKVILFYKEGPNPREWWGLYKTSNDGGKTWSKAVQIMPGFMGPIKNKTVGLSNGMLLHPSSFEINGLWTSHVEISDPALKNWTKKEIHGPFNAIQPTVLFHPNNHLQVLTRTKEGVIATAWSPDNGETWSQLESTGIVHNNSGIDAVTLDSGYHLLLCNPIPKGRQKLSLMGSSDGITWEELLVLEDEKEGEFSYPAIIQAKDGTVHLTYTWNREKIKYAHLSL
ncbi:putative neuraminidase [Algoriphagus zhangzhouensis]|uniref:Predicted neuraminidase (Sialidase) n=2 Tax=Algoriphagus zhangzhouensis TaxID=1073327 RepID=A0A1M7ZDU5_9BACT|nr:putative neuraminidase [Algoriphagus zhangzhouensis]SHO63101.1 Predicted neuraminidase (sialidase) [Algoriphagus zhangzhouensis]